eukprot:761205-Hanusia_phi.AAC.4
MRLNLLERQKVLRSKLVENLEHQHLQSARSQSSKLIHSYQSLLAAKTKVMIRSKSCKPSHEVAENEAWKKYRELDTELVKRASCSKEPSEWASMSWSERLETCNKVRDMRRKCKNR